MAEEQNKKAQKLWPSSIIEQAANIEILLAHNVITLDEAKGLLRGKSFEEMDAEKSDKAIVFGINDKDGNPCMVVDVVSKFEKQDDGSVIGTSNSGERYRITGNQVIMLPVQRSAK